MVGAINNVPEKIIEYTLEQYKYGGIPAVLSPVEKSEFDILNRIRVINNLYSIVEMMEDILNASKKAYITKETAKKIRNSVSEDILWIQRVWESLMIEGGNSTKLQFIISKLQSENDKIKKDMDDMKAFLS